MRALVPSETRDMSTSIDWHRHLRYLVPTFLLVDPMLGDPAPDLSLEPSVTPEQLEAARELAWQRPVHVITLHDTIALPQERHPYLVSMEGPDDPWLDHTWEIAKQEQTDWLSGGIGGTGLATHRIGGWLQSSLPPAQVVLALSRLMRLRTEATTDASYLRLADRRVLQWLRLTLGDDRLSCAMAGISAWLYLDPLAHLSTIRSAEATPVPLQFNATEWKLFIEGDRLHRIVATWIGEKSLAGHPAGHDLSALYKAAQSASRQATSAAQRWPGHFQSERDFIVWAALTLAHPEHRMPTSTASATAPISEIWPELLPGTIFASHP